MIRMLYFCVYTCMDVLLCCSLQGTKNVAKELRNVSVGKVAARGNTWFSELVDKS